MGLVMYSKLFIDIDSSNPHSTPVREDFLSFSQMRRMKPREARKLASVPGLLAASLRPALGLVCFAKGVSAFYANSMKRRERETGAG